MATADRPLIRRLAGAIQELLIGAESARAIGTRHRLSMLLLNDAWRAFRVHSKRSGHPLRRGVAADQQLVLEWARAYLLEWPDVRRSRPAEPSDPSVVPQAVPSEVFVGETGSAALDASDADFNAELTEEDDSESEVEILAEESVNDVTMAGRSLWSERARGDEIGSILIVEDESFRAVDYGRTLHSLGFQVTYAVHAGAALRAVAQGYFDVVVIDIRMPNRPFYTDFESVNGYRTGMLLASDLAGNGHVGTLVALTNSKEPLDEQWFRAQEGYHFCSKDQFGPDRFARFIAVNVMRRFEYLKCFIVHGRALPLVEELQGLLQDHLKFKEATVLWETPSVGQTVIGKFEFHASTSDLVFVLATPDETRVGGEVPVPARPNVFYEAGYFHALLGRLAGRVILLFHADAEYPSDLSGVIYIDITGGIAAAWEQIETELKGVFGPEIYRDEPRDEL